MASPFTDRDILESLRRANEHAEMAERKPQEERVARSTAEAKVKEERQLREELGQNTNISEYPDPRGRFLPTTIAPWIDFPSLQVDLFGRLIDLHESNGKPRVFPSRDSLKTLGEEYARKPQGLRFAYEICIETLYDRSLTLPGACELGMAGWISFEDHDTALGIAERERSKEKSADSSKEGCATPEKPPRGPEPGRYITVIAADGTRTVACYAKEIPPHKFRAQLIRDGLESLRHTDILRDIANNPRRGDEAHRAKRFVAAVMTQTFDYMIRGGLEYSYITNGEAFLFLYIPSNNPSTLLYHLSEPAIDVAANPQDPFRYTAVSQVSALILLALRSQRRTQRWYRELPQKLRTWKMDDDLIVE